MGICGNLVLIVLLKMCGLFFCRVYKGGDVVGADPGLDYAANFAHMLGFEDDLMHELMRLYLSIHRLFLRAQHFIAFLFK